MSNRILVIPMNGNGDDDDDNFDAARRNIDEQQIIFHFINKSMCYKLTAIMVQMNKLDSAYTILFSKKKNQKKSNQQNMLKT